MSTAAVTIANLPVKHVPCQSGIDEGQVDDRGLVSLDVNVLAVHDHDGLISRSTLFYLYVEVPYDDHSYLRRLCVDGDSI